MLVAFRGPISWECDAAADGKKRTVSRLYNYFIMGVNPSDRHAGKRPNTESAEVRREHREGRRTRIADLRFESVWREAVSTFVWVRPSIRSRTLDSVVSNR